MAPTEKRTTTRSASRNASNVHSIWIRKFHEKEFKIFSQNGEDGVLLWIFANIGTVNSPPRFVEFGTENGNECNTRFLRQQLGWEGLMMDGNHDIPSINLFKEMVTAENINQLLEKYQTPALIDLLSIDLDFDDYYVWKSILQANRYHARVVVIEYNYLIPPNENRVVDRFQDTRRWTGSTHYGAGILAMAALGRAYNYTLVYAEKNGVNLFFIQKDILLKQQILDRVPPVQRLHVKKPQTGWSHPVEIDKSRRWLWNDTIWIPD
ncbi:unnamed protein product [Adineta ricciae]|uniref:Uncharacterized protein n=1 Tax=Adineta ricciae TaxID=249248 RepID=A0A815S7K6_ADIRI|nr:unnamed protein product [Adineta ricciae]